MTDTSSMKKKILATENESTSGLSESQLILVKPEIDNQIHIEPSNSNLTDLSLPPNLPILGAITAIAIVIITLLWQQYQKYFGNKSLQPQVNSAYSTEAYGWDNETWSSDRRDPLIQKERSVVKEKVFAEANSRNSGTTQTLVKENKATFDYEIMEPTSVSQGKLDQESLAKEHLGQIETEQVKTEKSILNAENSSKTEQAKKEKDYLAWNNRGITLANSGELQKAVASFDKALRLKPDYDQAWSNRGITLISLGKYKKAVSSFDKAIKAKADYAQAWNGRGLALASLGQYQEALLAHNQALEIESDDAEAWNNRGSALFNLNRLEEAIASYEKALEIQPEKDSAWCNRGFALAALGKLDEAISSYIEAIRIQPNHHAAQYKLSCAYAQQSSLEPALANLAHAIELKAEYLEMAKRDPDFNNIRDQSQFQTLLKLATN